jgi:hypothetical protein
MDSALGSWTVMLDEEAFLSVVKDSKGRKV